MLTKRVQRGFNDYLRSRIWEQALIWKFTVYKPLRSICPSINGEDHNSKCTLFFVANYYHIFWWDNTARLTGWFLWQIWSSVYKRTIGWKMSIRMKQLVLQSSMYTSRSLLSEECELTCTYLLCSRLKRWVLLLQCGPHWRGRWSQWMRHLKMDRPICGATMLNSGHAFWIWHLIRHCKLYLT